MATAASIPGKDYIRALVDSKAVILVFNGTVLNRLRKL